MAGLRLSNKQILQHVTRVTCGEIQTQCFMQLQRALTAVSLFTRDLHSAGSAGSPC